MEYLTYDRRFWAADIEADDLRDKATTIHCVCVENIQDGTRKSFLDKKEFKIWMDAEDRILIGHNFLAYDAPLLNKLWGTRIPARKVIDTIVLSQMYSPSLGGGHGLNAWGERLGNPKLEFHDFTKFTPEMLEYCVQDVALTADVYRVLVKRLKSEGFSERGVELEHIAWHLIQNKQKQNGFPFDQEKADLLYAELRAREEQLKEEIYKLWPPTLQHVRTFARARKANGERTENYRRHLGQYPRLEDNEDGTYNAYDYVSFDLGSPKQRIQKLLDNGWEPVNFTAKGSPKIDEDEMLAFAESSHIPEAALLAKWCVVNARANMVRTWTNAVNPKTGHIHGTLWLASTVRYRHSSPNTANIPGVRHDKEDNVLYGEAGTWAYECRSLWTAGDLKEWRLVGIDGKGMQLRCLAHNVAMVVGVDAAQEFIDDLLTGDPHRKNMALHGFPSKPAAKKAIYCVPLDTRALTKKGWKRYDEIRVGELVLTYNKELRTQEWQPVLEKCYFEDAPVWEMGHSSYRVRATPNHRWVVQNRRKGGSSDRLSDKDRPLFIETTENFTTELNVIVNGPLQEESQISGFDWMSLPKYGTDWVQVVMEMTQQERRAFLAGFYIADGFELPGNAKGWSQLEGSLYEGALMASYLVHDGCITVSSRQQPNGNTIKTVGLRAKPHVTTTFFKYKELENQPVWCIRTQNETWVMRQGDIITVTGNTILMGGGDAKIAADQVQFGWSPPRDIRQRVINSIPGFSRLISKLQGELSKTGRITLCDGTRLLVPSEHMVIPYLLQGDESRLMKQTAIYIDEEVRKRGLSNDILKVGDVHDEFQTRVRTEYTDDYVDFALPCFERAGDSFGYLIPIEGSAAIGNNWAETH